MQRWVLPPGTAAVATSLDLILDGVGLDLELWEWSQGGPYAPEVLGYSALCPLVLAQALTARRTREQLTRLCSTGSTMDDYWGGLRRDEWAVQ